jgi:hypothetical protein
VGVGEVKAEFLHASEAAISLKQTEIAEIFCYYKHVYRGYRKEIEELKPNNTKQKTTKGEKEGQKN